jgi:hypothetical protein
MASSLPTSVLPSAFAPPTADHGKADTLARISPFRMDEDGVRAVVDAGKGREVKRRFVLTLGAQ